MVLNPMIKQVVINLHIKYEHSSVHSCREIFNDCHSSKHGWKENWTNTGKNKQKAASQSHDTTSHHKPAY